MYLQNSNYLNIISQYGHFRIGYHLGNLCDALLITPVFKKIQNATIEMYDNIGCRERANIFKDIANVVHVKKPIKECPKTKDPIHRSQQMLDALNITDVNFIPFIKLTTEEVDWATNLLKGISNPLVFCPFVSNSYIIQDKFAQARTFDIEMMRFLIKEFSRKYTLIQFPVTPNPKELPSCNFIEINGIKLFRDLNVRQLAACFKVIGKYLGADTGPAYLMVAVGGKIIEILPMDIPHIYPYWEYIYINKDLWKEEKNRCIYLNMSEYKKSVEYINFDF